MTGALKPGTHPHPHGVPTRAWMPHPFTLAPMSGRHGVPTRAWTAPHYVQHGPLPHYDLYPYGRYRNQNMWGDDREALGGFNPGGPIGLGAGFGGVGVIGKLVHFVSGLFGGGRHGYEMAAHPFSHPHTVRGAEVGAVVDPRAEEAVVEAALPKPREHGKSAYPWRKANPEMDAAYDKYREGKAKSLRQEHNAIAHLEGFGDAFVPDRVPPSHRPRGGKGHG